MSDALGFLTSSEQIKANYEKYKDRFSDQNAELVNSETFLNLLVAEMTNQDPLEPTSNTEFVTQMAQFTSLQYAQDSSKYAQSNYAASLVGKTVTASKMDGSDHVIKTGVVEQVVKSGDTYNVIVDGVTFDLANIQSVVTPTDSSAGAVETVPAVSLGDTIARASMMIGMYATVNPSTDSGKVLDAGIIDSIQVKDGEVNVVINDIAYKLTDVIEVKYPEYEYPETDGETETDEAAESVQQTDTAYEAAASEEYSSAETTVLSAGAVDDNAEDNEITDYSDVDDLSSTVDTTDAEDVQDVIE